MGLPLVVLRAFACIEPLFFRSASHMLYFRPLPVISPLFYAHSKLTSTV